jgi:hypothetical protein
VSIDSFLRTPALASTAAKAIYLALGPARGESGGRPYFALWASEPVDLAGLCAELSRQVSGVCVAWKSEHGGVAGYLIFRDGAQTQNVAESAVDYLLLPSRGVEEAFATSLALAQEDRLGFLSCCSTTRSPAICYAPVRAANRD